MNTSKLPNIPRIPSDAISDTYIGTKNNTIPPQIPEKKRAIYKCTCSVAKIVNSQQPQSGKPIKHPATLRPNLFAIIPTVKLVKAAVMHVTPISQDTSSSDIGLSPTGGFSLCSCGIIGDCQPIILPNDRVAMFAKKKSNFLIITNIMTNLGLLSLSI